MFKALCAKEWRQLRLLRWAGSGIGLLLPPLLLALTAASDRGWLIGSTSGSAVPTVVQEALPLALALAVWPVLSLMTAAQAFTADRAAGTDAFLLERPIPRARIWQARMLAVVGTTIVIVAATVVIWWLAVRLLGNPAAFDESAALGRMLLQGGLAIAIAVPAGAAAGAFARTPIQAALLGLVLAAIAVAIGALFFGSLFWGYRIQGVPIGTGLPVLLLVGYLLASFRMECRGEPAGRGRLQRGIVVVVLAFLAIPLLFAATAPLVMRWDARLGLGNTSVIPAPSGGAAVVLNNRQRAAWLIDTASAKRLRFFPPPIFGVAWSEDGSRLALLHGAGTVGRHLRALRLDVFDTAGVRQGTGFDCEGCREWWDDDSFWNRDRLVLAGTAEGRDSVLIVDPMTGDQRTVAIPRPAPRWTILRASADGSLYVLRILRERSAGDRPKGSFPDAVLHRIDVAGGTLQDGVELAEPGHTWFARRALSPSGRLWLRSPESRGENARVLDLASGETVELAARYAAWLADDRLAWLEHSEEPMRALVVGLPPVARPVRSLPGSGFMLEPSPDRSRLLITSWSGGGARSRRWIFEPGTDRWIDLPPSKDGPGWLSMQWAGARQLAVVNQSALALMDPDDPEDLHYVIGRPGS